MKIRERFVMRQEFCETYRLESGLPIFKVIDDTAESDPFLLCDHIGPVTYLPGEAVGAPDHPHRGIELISVLLQGGIHHADSIGHDSVLGPGSVQHIKFGRGFVHFEMPSSEMVERGGTLEGYQLWVNLPPAEKMCQPEYHEYIGDSVPVIEKQGTTVRVLSGSYQGVEGPITCVTPVLLLDVTVQSEGSLRVEIPDQFAFTFVYALQGSVGIGTGVVNEHSKAVLGQGESVGLHAVTGACRVLIGAGVPLNEPVVKYGPFAMSSEEEIREAILEYRNGMLGECPPPGQAERQRMIERAIACQRTNGRDV